jgi:hypothetical protein
MSMRSSSSRGPRPQTAERRSLRRRRVREDGRALAFRKHARDAAERHRRLLEFRAPADEREVEAAQLRRERNLELAVPRQLAQRSVRRVEPAPERGVARGAADVVGLARRSRLRLLLERLDLLRVLLDRIALPFERAPERHAGGAEVALR